ncbi:hypothetical protein AH814_22270 [Salmonella enterica subsp. enterica serovar Rubislaw]|nr:hypothetical protein [Salmonella enterica subsp. enterica serovar Rubislaw]
MSNLSSAVRVFGGTIIQYTSKQTGAVEHMSTVDTLADYDETDRSVGRGFIAEQFTVSDDFALIKRLQSDVRVAHQKGFDYILIIPQDKRIARGRGQAQRVVGDYELLGYGKLNDTPIEALKQPVKA